MKIFTVSQIKEWDAFTIQEEQLPSIELMERAATACCDWIIHHFDNTFSFKIFCGRGNNGGDGLAIARLLIENLYTVSVYITGDKIGSDNFEKNLERLNNISNDIYFLKSEASFPPINNEIIIDALFGSGLNKKPEGIFAQLICYINKSTSKIISIDIASGLFVDKSSKANDIIKASYTLSFQNQKLAFLMPENEAFTGEVVLMDIKLSKDYEKKQKSLFEFIDPDFIQNIYIPRKPFAHKGNFGYACLLAGSYGMMGAAVLSAGACLRSGVGKLTCYICETGYDIMQASVPESMCKVFGNKFLKDVNDFKRFDVVGVGPGIGNHISHKELLQNLFDDFKKPIVLDADALNVLSENPSLYQSIPAQSIITPHPKEFERLFGKSESDFDRLELAFQKAKELNIYIVLKGHYTFIATPDGKGYFNSTGNSGMATAGSGDVLTGIITGLIAQKYTSRDACILGVYIHGMAGDIAAAKNSKEALIAGDIIKYLGEAYKEIEETHSIRIE